MKQMNFKMYDFYKIRFNKEQQIWWMRIPSWRIAFHDVLPSRMIYVQPLNCGRQGNTGELKNKGNYKRARQQIAICTVVILWLYLVVPSGVQKKAAFACG